MSSAVEGSRPSSPDPDQVQKKIEDEKQSPTSVIQTENLSSTQPIPTDIDFIENNEIPSITFRGSNYKKFVSEQPSSTFNVDERYAKLQRKQRDQAKH